MACQSLAELTRICGSGAITAGVNQLYLIAYKDLSPMSATNSEVYTMTNAGVVNGIGVTAGSTNKFVTIETTRGSVGAAEKLTKDIQKGSSFITQTLTVTIVGINTENRAFVNSVLNQPVAAILKGRQANSYYVLGLNGQLELSEFDGGTGTAEGDLIGYSLTFTGIESQLIPLLDSTLISTITS